MLAKESGIQLTKLRTIDGFRGKTSVKYEEWNKFAEY